MKFAAAVLALAATVAAVPTHPTNPPPAAGKCNNDHPNIVCCNGIISGLLCSVGLAGDSCSSGSYCCKSAPQNGLINVGLECIKL